MLSALFSYVIVGATSLPDTLNIKIFLLNSLSLLKFNMWLYIIGTSKRPLFSASLFGDKPIAFKHLSVCQKSLILHFY